MNTLATPGVLYIETPTNDNPTREKITALNTANGKVLWQKQFTLDTNNENSMGVDSGMFYFINIQWDTMQRTSGNEIIAYPANYRNTLYAFKVADGSMLWKWQTSKESKESAITIG